MKVHAEAVSKGPGGRALPTISAVLESGRAVFVEAETAQRPTVLGLIVSGRMRADSGRVTLDGDRDDRGLRRRVALVDAPDVSEPHGDVRLQDVVAEELMFAGRWSGPIAVLRELDELGLREEARTPLADLAPGLRVRALSELALQRPGVEGIVIVSPDRHGGDPAEWWRLACEIAERGPAVMVIAGKAAKAALEARPEGWGSGGASAQVEVAAGPAPEDRAAEERTTKHRAVRHRATEEPA